MKILLGTAFLWAASPAVAEPVALQCLIEPEGSNGWIPDILFIGWEPDTGRVVISDPVVLDFNRGRPVEGKIDDDTPRRMSFVWSYAVRDAAGNGTPAMMYRATVQKSDLTVRVTARPTGFDALFTGRGQCAPVEVEQ